MTGAPAPCRFLPWDSEHFGKRVARYEAAVLDEASWTQARAWCRREAIDCLYVAAPLQGPLTTRIANEPGVVLADVRVLLERTGDDAPLDTKPDIRLGTVADLPALRPIAAASHTDSRFYQDPGFADRAPALFARWIERSFEGFAEAVWVAERAGQAVGYITCGRERETGSIGLLGVAASQRGQGLGPRLVAAALAWFADRGTKTVTVVTQGSNVNAQRLYLRAGFLPRALSLWFHCWRMP